MNILESRVDWLERGSQFQLADDSASGPAAKDKRPGEDALQRECVDYLLRSILSKQTTHNTDLRNLVPDQKRPQASADRAIGKLNSIEEALRDVDRDGRALSELLKALPKPS